MSSCTHHFYPADRYPFCTNCAIHTYPLNHLSIPTPAHIPSMPYDTSGLYSYPSVSHLSSHFSINSRTQLPHEPFHIPERRWLRRYSRVRGWMQKAFEKIWKGIGCKDKDMSLYDVDYE
jgi:hypothetical protein